MVTFGRCSRSYARLFWFLPCFVTCYFDFVSIFLLHDLVHCFDLSVREFIDVFNFSASQFALAQLSFMSNLITYAKNNAVAYQGVT